MKYTKKILLFVLMAMPMLMLQSCLHDEEEVFEKNSANRMTEYLENARKVILSGNATWMMEMYPNSSQSWGGYTFTFKFDGDKVSARSDLFNASKEVTSLWALTNDDGPVLTFDTYNEIIHYLSTPSGSSSTAGGYQAYQGEFGWIIMDVQQDVIKLRGKKTGNTIYMYRMTEDPETYIKDCQKIDESMIFTGLKLGEGESAINGIIDTDNRQVSFTSPKDTVDVAYCVTSTGIKLYEDIELMGKTYRDFTMTYNADGSPASMNSNGDAFAATFPEGWRSYNYFAGDYTLQYNGYEMDVTLEPAGDGANFKLLGLNDKYYAVVQYKKATGTLNLCSQVLKGMDNQPYKAANGNYIYLTAWAAAQGYVGYTGTYGLMIKWNGDEQNPKLLFSDNGAWGTYKASSFLCYYWKSATSTSSTNRVGAVNVAEDMLNGPYGKANPSNANRLPYPTALIKK